MLKNSVVHDILEPKTIKLFFNIFVYFCICGQCYWIDEAWGAIDCDSSLLRAVDGNIWKVVGGLYGSILNT